MNIIYYSTFNFNELTFQIRLALAMYRGCDIHDNDSERVHRWSPIEFIKMKLYRATKCKKCQIGLNNVFVSVIVESFVCKTYNTVIVYSADYLQCRRYNL